VTRQPPAYRPGAAGNAGENAGPVENSDISSVARSTTSTLWLASTVQPGWGHPELATTTASAVAR
jgi:hypothetical protein